MRSVEVAPRGPRPPIRLRPAPPLDPPFEDDTGPDAWMSAHQLTLTWPQPVTGHHDHGYDGRPDTDTGRPGDDPPGPPPATAAVFTTAASPAARLAVRQFVAVCVEVLNGFRPPAQLHRLSRPKDAAAIAAQALAGTRRFAEVRRLRGRTPRASDRHGRGRVPVAVLHVRLCQPRPGAVEAVVLLGTAERTFALALRLEEHEQRWLATTMRLI